MASYKRFEDTPAWRLAQDYAFAIFEVTREECFKFRGDLVNQIRRASLSVSIQGVPVTEFKYDEVRIHAGQYTFKIRQGNKEIRGHLDRNVKEFIDEERTIEKKSKKK